MGKTAWIIAGEESGDAYGARLATELARQCPGMVLRGMGGHAMAAAGVDLRVDSTELGVVGLVEVFRHLGVFIRVFRALVAQAAAERPDVVVLIDYPGFNLRFAKRLHGLGIPVVYYVSPQIWAWKRGRRHRLAAWCQRLLCIFPFEPKYYADTDLDVEFVGHPLVEMLREKRDPGISREPDLVLLLPGSRRGEIDRLLADMVGTAADLARQRPELRFVMPLPRASIAEHARQRLEGMRAGGKLPDIRIEVGETHRWMQRESAGMAASGTVTMEAAILGLPLVSIYRLATLTYLVGRVIIRHLPYFTIVNLIADSVVFEEFLQDEVRPDRLAPALAAILPGGSRRDAVLVAMASAVAALGGERQVSACVARHVLQVAGETR